jgi:hypothetical protein
VTGSESGSKKPETGDRKDGEVSRKPGSQETSKKDGRREFRSREARKKGGKELGGGDVDLWLLNFLCCGDWR